MNTPKPKSLAVMTERYRIANDLAEQRPRCRAAADRITAPELRRELGLWQQRMGALFYGPALAAALASGCSGESFSGVGTDDMGAADVSWDSATPDAGVELGDSEGQDPIVADGADTAPAESADLPGTRPVDARVDAAAAGMHAARPIDPIRLDAGSVAAPEASEASEAAPEASEASEAAPEASEASEAAPEASEAAPEASDEVDAEACVQIPAELECLKSAIGQCAEKGGLKVYCSGNPLSNTCQCVWAHGASEFGRGLECGRAEVEYELPPNLCH